MVFFMVSVPFCCVVPAGSTGGMTWLMLILFFHCSISSQKSKTVAGSPNSGAAQQ